MDGCDIKAALSKARSIKGPPLGLGCGVLFDTICSVIGLKHSNLFPTGPSHR